jgi:predicted RNase H-like HicB family nuclease
MNLEDLKLKLTAVFEPAPEGGFTCHFEELPEIFSEGETLDEARTNLFDALTQVMEYHREEAKKNARPGTVREELKLAARETAGSGAASSIPRLLSRAAGW